MSANFNSFWFFVRDATGQEFLHMAATNRPGAVEAARKHAKQWLRYRRRPAAHRDTDVLGNPLRSPVGKVEVFVDFYNDPTSP